MYGIGISVNTPPPSRTGRKLCSIIVTALWHVCVCVCGSPVYTFLTLDVIEAMCSCLVAEAEDGEQCRRSDGDQELRIISEFSRCLTQVVDSASRTRGKQSLLVCKFHTVYVI